MENPFEHFVFGRQSANPGKQSTPSLGTATAAAAAARKSRAHSRSGSISQSISVPAAPVSAPEQPPSMPRSRPTSTHKRHSSVSNRRESAELMGIALPPEDPAKENQAVQDPVLRALLALEGNRSSSSSPRNSFNNRFAKVQIPDFDALDAAEAAPEPRMPALSLNSSLAGKRDSFGKLLTPASSIHMELGTLIEEEEEDEDVVERSLAPTFLALPRPVSAPPAAPTQTLAAAPAPAFVTPPPQPLRARPHNLDLRALTVSTAPNVVQPPTSDSSSIPTPAATPSTRVTGLKSLTLSSSPLISASPSPLTGGAKFGSAISSPAKTLNRKSSISYRRSDDDELSPRSPPPQSIAYGRPSLLSTFLLTPEPTPTSSSPPGTPSEMSPSRRTFIYHSHAALVSRVSELERLLAIGVPTPVSTTSNEFLALIADLKSERDELKRDAQGYLSRISDLEKQNATLSNRIEKERREGWALREQLGGLQIEKTGLQSDHKKLKAANDGLQDQVAALQAQLAQMRNERDDALEASRARPMLKRVLMPIPAPSRSIR
ncbi:hypothetical protein BKA62DRAFT_82134 [Auriculariales sp. MPI-PUGE-AT-0066]|nr:hypothetical protein BKA62DRAFT_82134 [Auriculariales sp. MPI-PUGE-AT-0066]